MLHGRSLAIGFAGGLVVGFAALFARDTRTSARIDSLTTAVEAAAVDRAAAVESVTVFVPVVRTIRAESDRLAEIVRTAGETTLSVQLTPNEPPQLVEVPPQVVALIESQGKTIAHQEILIGKLEAALAADSSMIDAQAGLIDGYRKERPPRCQAKCGAGIALGVLALLKLGLAVLGG